MGLARIAPTGDLDLAGGRRFVRDRDYIAQKIRQRLLFFRGEWYKDTTLGVPWIQQVFVKNPSLEVIRGLVRTAILAVPGVTSCPTCTIDYDRATRSATITFVCVYGQGQTLEDTVLLSPS